MIIKSNYKKTPYSEIELFNICKDLNNAIKYLPSEVENINTDSDNLSFTVKGMGNIALRISNRVETIWCRWYLKERHLFLSHLTFT